MKKFIVTDPCYLLPDNTWQSICHEVFDGTWNDQKEMYEAFDSRVQEELRKFAGTDLAWTGSTGIGDWCNGIDSKNSKVVNVVYRGFGADAGMVCVCELTDIISKTINDSGIQYDWSVACFEVSDDSEVSCNIDKSNSNWTVVKVYVNDELVIESNSYGYPEEYEDEDDDDEFEDDDYEEED